MWCIFAIKHKLCLELSVRRFETLEFKFNSSFESRNGLYSVKTFRTWIQESKKVFDNTPVSPGVTALCDPSFEMIFRYEDSFQKFWQEDAVWIVYGVCLPEING